MALPASGMVSHRLDSTVAAGSVLAEDMTLRVETRPFP
jgi:hypothetical protein